MEQNVFGELSLIIAIATGVSILMRLIKQPLIIGYILTGVIVGPSLLNLMHNEATISVFSKLGISLLLFLVGLGLNPKVIKEVGRPAVLAGMGQITFYNRSGIWPMSAPRFCGNGIVYYQSRNCLFKYNHLP